MLETDLQIKPVRHGPGGIFEGAGAKFEETMRIWSFDKSYKSG